MMVEADEERQTEFFKFQREQAELNHQHELKIMELLMKLMTSNHTLSNLKKM